MDEKGDKETYKVLVRAYEASFLQAVKAGVTKTLKMKENGPKSYTYILSKISTSSENEVKKPSG